MSSVKARAVAETAVPAEAKRISFLRPLPAFPSIGFGAEANGRLGVQADGLVRPNCTRQVEHVHCREPMRPAKVDNENGCMLRE